MQFFTAATLLATAGAAAAVPTTLEARTNTCFDGVTPVCLGANNPNIGYSDRAATITAIQAACAKQPTCVPGTQYNAVQSRFPGWTVTLILGKQCAGVTNWNVDTCTGIFIDNLDAKCGGVSTDALWRTGYTRSVCDSTYISVNLGG